MIQRESIWEVQDVYPHLANSTDLAQWAVRRNAQSTLPILVRRLILATCPEVQSIGFAGDEGVQSGGWDGVVTVASGDPFVPGGQSAWELGTGKGITTKANEDYEKRTADPLNVEKAAATFIFVTMRRWSTKAKWADEKRAEGQWNDVIAYDADDLATWLEHAPAVHLWISALVGKPVDGVEPLDQFWDEWTTATDPPVSPELLLSGRDEERKHLCSALQGTAKVLEIRGSSTPEVIAFLAATFSSSEDLALRAILDRTVIVRDESKWAILAAGQGPLFMVAEFSDASRIHTALRRGHFVVKPTSTSGSVGTPDISLPRLDKKLVAAALAKMGVAEKKRGKLASHAHISIDGMRRKIAVHPSLLAPKWADAPTLRKLLPAILVGSWDESNDADKERIAELADEAYSSYREFLLDLAERADPPLRLIDEIWCIIGKDDLWSMVAAQVRKHVLKRFEELVLIVCGEVDPKYSLDVEVRWMANIHRAIPSHSERMRNGLIDSVCLLGASDVNIQLNCRYSGQGSADRIVSQLLSNCDTPEVWLSISPFFTALAEASPDGFLEGIERRLVDEQFVSCLFTDATSCLDSSPHFEILWALEKLAWSPRYLGMATTNLARLASLDPGGTTTNRPSTSLRKVFLPWMPGTVANIDQRLRAIDQIRAKHPRVGWALLFGLIPRPGEIASSTAKPRRRPWAELAENQPDSKTISDFVSSVFERLMKDASTDGKRWSAIIGRIGKLKADDLQKVLRELMKIDLASLSSDGQIAIRNSLRRITAQHRKHADANWAFDEMILKQLVELYESMAPSDPVANHGWLFESGTELIDGISDWQAEAEEIRRRRVAVAELLLRSEGIDGIYRMGKVIGLPEELGIALSGVDPALFDFHNFLQHALGNVEPNIASLGRAALRGRRIKTDGNALDTLRRSPTWSGLTSLQKSEAFRACQFESSTWDAILQEGSEVHKEYWASVRPFHHTDQSPRDCERALENLSKSSRLFAGFKFLASYSQFSEHGIEAEIVVDFLETLATTPSSDRAEDPTMFAYRIGTLIKGIRGVERIEKGRIAFLEWAYLPQISMDGRPETLFRALAESPSLFVVVLSHVFRRSNDTTAKVEAENEFSDRERLVARRGSELLQSWDIVPGTNHAGQIELEALRDWILQARTLAGESGRSEIADIKIGQILARCGAGEDGIWPQEAVREILEENLVQDIEDAMKIELSNLRGVWMKHLDEGGDQERSLAKKYREWANLLRDEWPRSAGILENVARSYDSSGASEDYRSDLEDADRNL